ncbi:DUF3783 domain-containing protein [Clostridium sp. CS001]|uniref:DUF3783 domain-containing protein n=1 Tax=Clostridium sp. CS001 TaxID=2880648 RepID=UPI001CF2F6EB|nr:DUF3783 domain-containing protein [Clostridium sp. CS001]MCB2291504.1 DUF3783 domain-containing protein [Clostridium sp. CS001]
MELINEKLILAYGLTKEEQERLNSLLSKKNILPCKIIEKNMGNVTIKEILSHVQWEESGVEGKGSNAELPNEKLLLFSNYMDKELFDLIASIREVKPINTIQAAVTPTSINWTISYLLQHLIEEREAYRKNTQS